MVAADDVGFAGGLDEEPLAHGAEPPVPNPAVQGLPRDRTCRPNGSVCSAAASSRTISPRNGGDDVSNSVVSWHRSGPRRHKLFPDGVTTVTRRERPEMYRKDDVSYFIVDAHIALWDARPENQRNIHGKQFIDCFYDYHRNLSPESEVWSYEEYLYQGGERLMNDLFRDGYVDHAIFQPVYLGEFYYKGFGQTDEAFELATAHPDKLTYNHYFDPRNGEAGLDRLREDAEKFGLQGVKLYTAEWHGDSRGWRLDDPWAYRYFEACRELGIRNIHVHKGPTIRPLDRDAFDVADVDHVASDFTDLNFIVEHCGLPRLEDFCWIATQEPNVHAGLAVAMPFIHTRPKYFGQIIGELLYWVGEDRIQFASDYALWTPRWLIEAFVDFQIPEDLGEYAPITTDQKKKILGLNAAKMYDIPVPAELQLPSAGEPAVGPRGADNLVGA